MRSRQARDLLIKVITDTAGLSPDRARDSEAAERALYALGASQVIINWSSEEMLRKIRFPTCALSLQVENPYMMAEKAQEIFHRHGYHAIVVSDAEPEFPPRFLNFVVVPDLKGLVLLYVPKNPDPEVLKHIPKVKPWSDALLQLPKPI